MKLSSATTAVLVSLLTLLGCWPGSASAQSAAKLSISASSTTVTFQLTYSGTPSYVHVYIDSDQNATTGYPVAGIGADYLIENGFLYKYAGSGGSWAWTEIKSVALTKSNGVATWNIAPSDLGSPSAITAVGNYNSVYSSALSYTLVQATRTTLSINASSTAVAFLVTYSGTPGYVRVFVDADKNAATGYPVGGIGADYLIENGFLYGYSGSSGSWAWTEVKSVSLTESNGVASWSVVPSDLGSPSAITAIGNYDSVYSSAVSATLAAQAPPPPSPGTTRNALQWPFAATSIWNMPIGSGAQYVASGLHFTTTPNSTEYWYDLPQSDHERIVLTPSAPLTSVYLSSVGWSGGDRCAATGGVFFQAPIPAGYLVPNSTDNNGAAVLLADGVDIVQTQPFTKCSGYSYATTMQVPYSLSAWEYNLKTGDGRLGAHGGSDLATLGGTIRLGELRPGTQMRHALKVNVDSVTSLGLCTGNFGGCFVWPAATADGYAANAGSGYGSATNNTNSAMKMGALLAIPASVNLNSIGLQSVPGKMLAWTLQNYGAYIVDSRGSPGFDFAIEDGASGSKADEFQSDYGYPFDGRLGYMTLTNSSGQPTPQAQWVADIRLIIDYLRVVSNNSAASIGGGGTPLQPLAPAFQ